jgi:cytosine/adenosine deaminase-related metal-dependent hydrolase
MGMPEVDVFLTNCRLADGRLLDIGIAGGKIAVMGEGAGSLSNSAPARDIGGDLALPGLVDGHMHLDKTLTGLPWMGHAAGPTRMSRIETDKTILPHLPVSTEERAGNLIRECVARGTTHLRTHVDIDLESGLAKLEGVLAARERYRDQVTVQIVAFPQSGVMRCPGILDLLDAAVRNGADLVGGIDPLEIDRDPKGQLDGIFTIAERHGVGLDIHLHEPGDMGLFNVEEICARTKALGLGGKVTISHGFCLGGITEAKAAKTAETMAGAGVALVTHGAGGLPMPPIEMLRAAGVSVFAGNDDIRDTWSPYGTGDLLERAAIIGWKGDFRHDSQVEVAFDLISAAGAKALGIADYGVAVGATANLFTIAASCVPEAVAAHPPRKLVLFEGKVVARDGSFLATPIPIASLDSA